MIPFFPTPAPGETVYSAVCRYAVRSGLPEQYLLKALTGQVRRAGIMSAIPGYIDLVSESMPIGHPWCNSTELIKSHTGLPYFVYFLKEGVRQSWAREMIGRRDSHPILLALGLTTYPCPTTPDHPRFCLQCAADQRQKFGFSFFRRDHQLPGVLVCFEHGQILNHGCEKCGPYPIKRQGLFMPGSCNCRTIKPLPIINTTFENLEPLVWLARESAFLVNSYGTTRSDICAGLMETAIRKGFARGSLIDYRKLASGIEARFGSEILREIGVPIWVGERPSAWIRRLFYADRHNRKGHSILRLLVIGTLFDSVKSFEAEQPSPSCQITEAKCRTRGAVAKAVLPDLKEHIENKNGLAAIAERYSVGMYAVAREIRRQGLRYPLSERIKNKLGDKLVAIQEDLAAGYEIGGIRKRYNCSEELLVLIQIDKPELVKLHSQNSKLRSIEKHRELLKEYLTKNPDSTRSKIQKTLPATYEFFLRVDKTWFYEQLPKRQKNTMAENKRPRNSVKNWAKVDAEKSKELESMFIDFYNNNEKPIWLTKNGMLKRVGIQQKYLFDPSKFPNVTATLNKNVETREVFIRRRLDWAMKKIALTKETISIDNLRRVAWIGYPTLRHNFKLICELAEKHGIGLNAGWES